MNLILEKTDQMRYFTDMREVFDAANIAPEDYDWYLSDIETNWTPPGFAPIDQWFSGEALASFLCLHQLQFIWAVFSAVTKGFRLLPLNAPYVEGNPNYWNGSVVEPQLDGGIFEIAFWDSSAIILINLPAQAEQAFISRFADTRLLATARA
ncbi:MAG: hypothetical protein JWP59_731 [Massilia sp.]|jgi:hypothetical protein|nr:hypothetical protein [Massilia sp.]